MTSTERLVMTASPHGRVHHAQGDSDRTRCGRRVDHDALSTEQAKAEYCSICIPPALARALPGIVIIEARL